MQEVTFGQKHEHGHNTPSNSLKIRTREHSDMTTDTVRVCICACCMIRKAATTIKSKHPRNVSDNMITI